MEIVSNIEECPENWYADVKDIFRKQTYIKVGSLTLLNTMCNASSPGTVKDRTFGRKCALNFMVAGDFERSYVQWATKGLNEDIENNDKKVLGGKMKI